MIWSLGLISVPTPVILFPGRRDGAAEDVSARAHKGWLQGGLGRRPTDIQTMRQTPPPCRWTARGQTRRPPQTGCWGKFY